MTRARTTLALVLAATLVLGACDDDGTGVRTIDGSDDGSRSASGSASGSANASGSASASGTASGDASGDLGGYEPVSDVTSHSRVSLDVCDIKDLLPKDAEIDFDAVGTIYAEGANSTSDDGIRTLQGYATGERDEPLWNLYVERFGASWLDHFVTAAIDGSGPFADEADLVRRQGVEKGVQNQILVSWALHEVDAARASIEAGELDPASGAPHQVDEIWAFYHGAAPSCAPFGTAESRGADFGTGNAANDRVLAATRALQQAAIDGDLDAYDQAYDELVTAVALPYVQATIKYATNVSADLAAGDAEAARIHQAEGWAFFRVIEPLVAQVDTDVADTIAGVLSLESDPDPESGDTVTEAIVEVYEGLGITAEDVGEFQG